jgi:hypothetical protein
MLNPPTAEPMNALPRPKVPEPGLKFMMRPGARDCRATTMTRIFLLPSGVARRRFRDELSLIAPFVAMAATWVGCGGAYAAVLT